MYQYLNIDKSNGGVYCQYLTPKFTIYCILYTVLGFQNETVLHHISGIVVHHIYIYIYIWNSVCMYTYTCIYIYICICIYIYVSYTYTYLLTRHLSSPWGIQQVARMVHNGLHKHQSIDSLVCLLLPFQVVTIFHCHM